MNVGERIKLRRKELGYNADYLADHLGVSRSTVFRYEKGDIEKLPTEILEKLATVLHTSPGFLMGWEEESKNSRIMNIFNQLTESRKDNVLKFTEKQLEEQNKVVPFKKSVATDNKDKNLEVLAAHIDENTTEDEMDEITAFIDSLRDED